MARQKEVPKLYTLVHQWLVEFVGEHIVRAGYDGCSTSVSALAPTARSASALAVSGLLAGCANQAQALSVVRMKIRPLFVETLPASVRATLIEDAANFLLRKGAGSNATWASPSSSMSPTSLTSSFDGAVDYGRSVLHLLHLLLSKEVRFLKVHICCYYCRDLEGQLRAIKKYGGGLERLELSRSSLLRMDPLLFRNVLTSASHLNTLVVRNICSDAMLKLIGDHCMFLQYLDISGSKQVSDAGIECLCFHYEVRDRHDPDRQPVLAASSSAANKVVAEIDDSDDFYEYSEIRGARLQRAMRRFLKRFRRLLRATPAILLSRGSEGMSGRWRQSEEGLVDVEQISHHLCHTLLCLDLTDTCITNNGLFTLLKKVPSLRSLGEFTISDTFLRSLQCVRSLQMDRFGLLSVHARRVSDVGMYNLVHIMSQVRSLTVWDPISDINDLVYLPDLIHLTLLRITLGEAVILQLLHYIREKSCLEKLSLDFVVPDEVVILPIRPFDIRPILTRCEKLKVFTIDFKGNALTSPHVSFSSYGVGSARLSKPRCFSTLVFLQFGQMVQKSVVAAAMLNCDSLKFIHCNVCPDLTDGDLEALCSKAACRSLQCFYVYEAPQLTHVAVHTMIYAFADLRRLGNFTRWAITCAEIQEIHGYIRTKNLDVEALCGLHWFTSKCSQGNLHGLPSQ